MAFTDDDLRRLKEHAEKSNFLDEAIPLGMMAKEIRTLLARLEAAETYAKRFSPIDPEDDIAFENWRKSCGKGEG